MKIHKLSNIIALPFILIIFYMGYLIYLNPDSNAMAWAVLPLMVLMLIYLFSPQIEYWWLTKRPISLDKPIVNMLKTTNPIYTQLEGELKNEFNKRLTLFVEGKEFIGKGWKEDTDNMPYDIKCLLSQIPITMTINRNKFTFKNFDRIILYKHPFPTPRYQFLHTAETMAEDGVIILSLEHVQLALFQKGHYYDVAWHAFSEAFMKINPTEPYPEVNEDHWEAIENISGLSQQQILGTLGFEQIDLVPVMINLYFNYRDKFRALLPDIFSVLEGIFVKVK